MTRDDIIRMAREQGLPETATEGVFIVNTDDLGRMLAAEREACAITAWSIGMDLHNKQFDSREVGAHCAAAIRARGAATEAKL